MKRVVDEPRKTSAPLYRGHFLVGICSLWLLYTILCPASVKAGEVSSLKKAFKKGDVVAGFSVGAGPGLSVLGADLSHDLALGFGHLGYIYTEANKNDRITGNLELWAELFTGWQFEPDNAYVVGLTLGPRFYFSTNSRWVPYVGIGAGFSATDIKEPDLSTIFEFNIQLSTGLYVKLSKDFALDFQVKGLHLSNAGLDSPNDGVNTVLFLAGASWLF